MKLQQTIADRIAAAKEIAELKSKPEKLTSEIAKMEQEIEETIEKIAAGEISGAALSGTTARLKSLDAKVRNHRKEFAEIHQKLRHLGAAVKPEKKIVENRSGIMGRPKMDLKQKFSLLIPGKIYTRVEIAEAVGNSTVKGSFVNHINRAVAEGILVEKGRDNSGKRGTRSQLYALASTPLPSEVMEEELRKKQEIEKKVSNLIPDPRLKEMDSKLYNRDQLKAILIESTGQRNPVALNEIISELEQSGHLQKVVFNNRTMFQKQ